MTGFGENKPQDGSAFYPRGMEVTVTTGPKQPLILPFGNVRLSPHPSHSTPVKLNPKTAISSVCSQRSTFVARLFGK
jgi:hypothetical protein